ncbi:MAG: putative toxin-antitoxin system toxin component, PIN family, partial [Thermoguttaceae bacterium]
LLAAEMQKVVPATMEIPICRDPQDDMILATAIAGNAECIVTGDEDLIVIGRYASVRILRPREFIDFETHR